MGTSSSSLIDCCNSLNQPPNPPILGDLFLKLGDTPRPPAGSILHLLYSGLIKKFYSNYFCKLCQANSPLHACLFIPTLKHFSAPIYRETITGGFLRWTPQYSCLVPTICGLNTGKRISDSVNSVPDTTHVSVDIAGCEIIYY